MITINGEDILDELHYHCNRLYAENFPKSTFYTVITTHYLANPIEDEYTLNFIRINKQKQEIVCQITVDIDNISKKHFFVLSKESGYKFWRFAMGNGEVV